MKLRLRSLESKATLKFEVPDSCSLQELEEILSQTISSPSSLYLSLNRKDEIQASSPDESLHSIGIATGDLIFYTLDPNAFSLETLVHKPGPSQIEPTNPIAQESMEFLGGVQKSQNLENLDQNSTIPGGSMVTVEIEKGNALPEAEEAAVAEKEGLFGAESTDIVDRSAETANMTKNSEPSFVRRVLREALGNDVTDQKLLVIAVHAVILESGFVRLDKGSGMAVGCSHLLDEWPSTATTITLRYALPEILTNGSGGTDSVVLKFQSLGQFVNIYGSLSDGGSGLHRVCLDKYKFARALEMMLLKSELNDRNEDRENEVFKLWKMVKDGLALPLLIDLCDKTGLDPPPCFMRLPTELKLKILECLPGVDVAKLACVCSELRYMSSSNDLWKQKFVEEFGQGSRGGGINFFKDLFVVSWKRKTELEHRTFITRPIIRRIRYFPLRRDIPNPFAVHSTPMMGGDYERYPVFGFASRSDNLVCCSLDFPHRRSLSPCNLGGFNN
ncbi:hypothetical protein L6164_032134 [Bauhinia variegata]|uniref:Uncharacterized protein n=1 Tax=Bauhinia variegata TaxID=167791 RepID=A0ACB9KN43_BAUVA|nr:hypothetical protein L6164_032134 [Bauhinia variegata]